MEEYKLKKEHEWLEQQEQIKKAKVIETLNAWKLKRQRAAAFNENITLISADDPNLNYPNASDWLVKSEEAGV
jgi:hypothetical protein